MKKHRNKILAGVVTCLIFLFVFGSMVFAEDGRLPIKETNTKVYEDGANEEQSICPRTKMDSNCMTCHTNDWRLKNVPWDAHIIYPNSNTKIYKKKDKQWGYYKVKLVDSDEIKEILDFFISYNINHIIFELQCYGGGAFEMWRIVGLMREWKLKGNIVETKLNGMAISAGFVIMASGSKGYRLVNPHAELMWHEVQSMSWPEITTPSKSEEKAKIFRHFQNTANSYLASVSKMTKEELDEKVNFSEFWITGKEAVEYGFADGFIGE